MAKLEGDRLRIGRAKCKREQYCKRQGSSTHCFIPAWRRSQDARSAVCWQGKPMKASGGAKERGPGTHGAQQQPAHAIAAIEAEQESRRAPPVCWYSDPAALSSEPESGPEPWGVVPL